MFKSNTTYFAKHSSQKNVNCRKCKYYNDLAAFFGGWLCKKHEECYGGHKDSCKYYKRLNIVILLLRKVGI